MSCDRGTHQSDGFAPWTVTFFGIAHSKNPLPAERPGRPRGTRVGHRLRHSGLDARVAVSCVGGGRLKAWYPCTTRYGPSTSGARLEDP